MEAEHLELLSGWGNTAPSSAAVSEPASAGEIAALLRETNSRGLICRGLGRSYGDPAQNAGGTVLSTLKLDQIINFDSGSGEIAVGAGISLDQLMRFLLPKGWFVAVTPGTRYVTVGGAIANDIHGKNHHCDGGFCANVKSMVLLTSDGRRLELTPESDYDHFWATAGGMGATGVITEATLKLIKVETSYISVDTERANNIDDLLARLDDDDKYRYSVSWVDCMARGKNLGRGVITRGDHATLAQLPKKYSEEPLHFDPKMRLKAPPAVPNGLLNRLSIKAFNELWFRKAPEHELAKIEPIHSFFHPLDGVDRWNSLYGSQGFVQYQYAVPYGSEEFVKESFELLSNTKCPSFLAVLKRFGEQEGYLSFPMPGWTLALDIPAGIDGLPELLDTLDGKVAAEGGRVYLAKDSRLRPDLLETMYPKLNSWRKLQAELDPRGLFQSDLIRRLGLI